jgi:peroxiredoxin
VNLSDENGHKAFTGNQTLENSHINRNGLPVGTAAPVFCLLQLDENELCLNNYRGRRVLLIFSDPNCGPCNQLAPQLESLQSVLPDLSILMVSRGDPDANQAKVSEHGLTFPIVLQRRWEISREYAMFATPIAYLIDEEGIIAAEVAVGVDAILTLAKKHEMLVRTFGEEQIMCGRLQTRLVELKKEFEKGRTRLQELEKEQVYLREAMLRISGAAQVLAELLYDEQAAAQNDVGLAKTQSITEPSNPVNLADDQRLSQDGIAVNTSERKE